MSIGNKKLSGVTQFKDMSDVLTYVGHANEYVRVNAAANGLTYASGLSVSNVYRTIEFVGDQAGFVGDGVADDATECNAAIAAAGVGGVVVFPELTIGLASKLNAIYDRQLWVMNNSILKPLAGFSTASPNDRIIDVGASGAELSELTILRPRFDMNNINVWAISNSSMDQDCKALWLDTPMHIAGSNFAASPKGFISLKNLEDNSVIFRPRVDRMNAGVGQNKEGIKIYQETNGGNIWIVLGKFSSSTTARDLKLLSIGRGGTSQFDRLCCMGLQFFENNDGDGVIDTGNYGIDWRFEDGGGKLNNKDMRVIDCTWEDLNVGCDHSAAAGDGGEIYYSNCHWDYKKTHSGEREPNHRLVRIGTGFRVTFDSLCSFFTIGHGSVDVNWYGIENNSDELVRILSHSFIMRNAVGTFIKVFGNAINDDPRTCFLGASSDVQFEANFDNTSASSTRYIPPNGTNRVNGVAARVDAERSLRKRFAIRGIVIKPIINNNANNVTFRTLVDNVNIGSVTINAGSKSQVTGIFTRTLGGVANCIREANDTALIAHELVFGAGTVDMQISGALLCEEFTLEPE